ncbi:hypothetical protein PSTG_02577 [Puccinia striiformis f. sp. tritici PST-78]|uniref:HTH CENPB-type domain-containing protein n=1 Tax=Puccinia striiformis f. sp. tritici PST-78 TaxID=1165861 RepID=A0A0L0VYF8_9BASI|nr:hypothetical protein PSTG_02577 [Puccinia striiformis f. sp. tritici PST-78]
MRPTGSETLAYPKVEAALSEWMTQAIHYGIPVSGEILKENWREFAWLDGIPSEEWLKLSSGWLESFKNQHQICAFWMHGEAASVDITVVESEIIRMQEITKDYELKDIFNMDKTGLFYSMPPDVGLAFKATHGREETTSLHWGVKETQCFKGHTADYYNYQYAHNSTAWMTAKNFQRWLMSWNSKLKEEDRNVLLLLDNFRGHTLPEGGVSNIRVEFFSPNLTSRVQPLDAGIIKCFKSYYQKKINLAINQPIYRRNGEGDKNPNEGHVQSRPAGGHADFSKSVGERLSLNNHKLLGGNQNHH